MISEKFIINPDKSRWKKGKIQKLLPSRGTRSIQIFVSLGGATFYCVFFVIKRIDGDVLRDVVLFHAALIVEEEHLVHLLLIIFSHSFLLSSESDSELLKPFF